MKDYQDFRRYLAARAKADDNPFESIVEQFREKTDPTSAHVATAMMILKVVDQRMEDYHNWLHAEDEAIQ